MMKVHVWLKALLFFGLALAVHSASWGQNFGEKSFLPKNDKKIFVGAKLLGPVTEQDFNNALDHVAQVYGPIVSARGRQLVINKLWSNPDVNAVAYQQGRTWFVDLYGGLARHPAMTIEGIYLVACHELGHHLGGSPKYSQSDSRWASVEGQSDYFATLKCLRRVFANSNNQIINEDPLARQYCSQSFSDAIDIDICVRSVMGGLASARMFQQLSGGTVPRLDTPDARTVPSTQETHPAYQCRLDTYLQGALCQEDHNVDVSDRDPEVGSCTRKKGDTVGLRPLCWYKPPAGGGGGGGGTASPPLLNGATDLRLNNPTIPVDISFDVGGITGAGGAYVEVSRPNQDFSNPNGDQPDRNALGGTAVRGTQGRIRLVPYNQLPGWGTYSIRIIPLDGTGRRAVGNFSNPSRLILLP